MDILEEVRRIEYDLLVLTVDLGDPALRHRAEEICERVTDLREHMERNVTMQLAP